MDSLITDQSLRPQAVLGASLRILRGGEFLRRKGRKGYVGKALDQGRNPKRSPFKRVQSRTFVHYLFEISSDA